VHMHIAEQTGEVDACIAWSGLRPVEWLLRHVPVDHRWCLIHATHMTMSETNDLAATGCIVGLCPMTEASLGDGIFPGEAWRLAGGRIGIGTDSNILIGVAEELRALEYGQRLDTRRRNVMADAPNASTGASLFAASLAGGAAALGVVQPALAPGMPADIVGLAADAACFAAEDAAVLSDCWIFGGSRHDVGDVWCGGHHVVEHGRHVAADAVLQRYRKSVRRLAAGS